MEFKKHRTIIKRLYKPNMKELRKQNKIKLRLRSSESLGRKRESN